MKLTAALCVLGALAQAGLAGKCSSYQSAPPASSDTPTPSASPPPSSTDYSSSSDTSAPAPTSAPAGFKVTLDQLNAAFPDAGQSGYCSGKKGCNTNQDAVAAINNAITKYNIKTRAQAVAVVAVMAFESEAWKYSVNEFPGRTGQGTKAMLMYNFVYSYAQSLYPDKVDPNAGSLQPTSAANNATMNGIRDLVTSTPNDNFGAGFWYLTNSDAGKPFYTDPAKLRDGNADDFNAYSTQGLGAPASPERITVWQTVNQNLFK